MSEEWERMQEIREVISAVSESIDQAANAIQNLDVRDRHDMAERVFLAMVGNAAMVQVMLQPLTRHQFAEAAYQLADLFLAKQAGEIDKQKSPRNEPEVQS